MKILAVIVVEISAEISKEINLTGIRIRRKLFNNIFPMDAIKRGIVLSKIFFSLRNILVFRIHRSCTFFLSLRVALCCSFSVYVPFNNLGR